MSVLSYPYRGGSHRALLPWSHRGYSSSFMVSPYHQRQVTDPFGFSQPFASLFNDTFNQLDRLSSELDTHLTSVFSTDSSAGTWQDLLVSAPKFDVKETESAYVLEGELPGIAKKDISLTFADDHTLVLATTTETFKERPNSAAESSTTPTQPSEMSGANPDAEPSSKDSTVATTGATSTDVAAPAPAFHLAERTHSTFQRTFYFPSDVKHDDVKASLQNGVLCVTVPKAESADAAKAPRAVTIEDTSESQHDKEMSEETTEPAAKL